MSPLPCLSSTPVPGTFVLHSSDRTPSRTIPVLHTSAEPTLPDPPLSALVPSATQVPYVGSHAPAPGDLATFPARHPTGSVQPPLPAPGNTLRVHDSPPPAHPTRAGTPVQIPGSSPTSAAVVPHPLALAAAPGSYPGAMSPHRTPSPSHLQVPHRRPRLLQVWHRRRRQKS